MIKINVMYPYSDSTRFDHDYYLKKHFPLVEERLSPHGLRGWGIEKGLGGGAPGEKAPYHSIGYMLFDSVEEFQAGMAKVGQELVADVPNYTDVQPQFMVSEVVK